jgi:purine-binding chemotaxis protein CheW
MPAQAEKGRRDMEGNGATGRGAGSGADASRGGRELIQLVSFHVGGEEFGLDILRVQEIIRIQQLTRVPNSPPFVDGVINLRGKVIPVIALRKRIGLEELAHDKQTRIVVVEVRGTVLGFIVDSVSEVLRIPADTVEPPPRLGKVEREYVSGVGKLDNRLLILLDVDRLLEESEDGHFAELAHAESV